MTRPSRALARRALTPDECTIARALYAPSVHYVAGSTDQRWVRHVCGPIALDTPGATLVTELTARRLVTLALRMRRQLPADVLAIAERLAHRSGFTAPRRGLSATTAAALLLLAVSAAGCRSCRYVPPGCNAPAPAPAPKDTVVR